MKKLLLTSVMAMSVIGGAHASVYLNWDAYDAETNPNGMMRTGGDATEHNFALVQNAINQNAKSFDEVHQIIADWNVLFFGENGDGTAGLFHDFYGAFNTAANARFDQLEMSFARLDRKLNDMNKDLSAGIASVAALSSVAVADVKRGEVSVGGGYGYHNGQSATAFGMAAGITDNWSMNAGVGLSSADATFRAGTNYKFKLF